MKSIKTEYLVLAPMVPMVVHIYTFFNAYDHWLIAGAVAITFDVTIFMLFRYLRTKEVRTDKIALRSVWIGIIIMTLFQLYVNIRVYWQVDPGADAVAMGTIFPAMFGFLSFISSRMEQKVESYRKVVGSHSDAPVLKSEKSVPDKNIDNRALCQDIFTDQSDKSQAISLATENGVPQSSAYRYWKEFKKEGSLV